MSEVCKAKIDENATARCGERLTVIDVSNDGHVTDLFRLVHKTADFIDSEFNLRMGDRERIEDFEGERSFKKLNLENQVKVAKKFDIANRSI